jgi:hypothetical protein
MDRTTRETLRSCNLVSHSFHSAARRIIFRFVRLDPHWEGIPPFWLSLSSLIERNRTSVKRFQEIATQSPQILSFVKGLHLQDGCSLADGSSLRPNWDGILELSRGMVNVEASHLDRVYLSGTFHWSSAPLHFKDAIRILKRQCISISLNQFRCASLTQFLASCSKLEHLVIEGVILRRNNGYMTPDADEEFSEEEDELDIHIFQYGGAALSRPRPSLRSLRIGNAIAMQSFLRFLHNTLVNDQAPFDIKSLERLCFTENLPTFCPLFSTLLTLPLGTVNELHLAPAGLILMSECTNYFMFLSSNFPLNYEDSTTQSLFDGDNRKPRALLDSLRVLKFTFRSWDNVVEGSIETLIPNTLFLFLQYLTTRSNLEELVIEIAVPDDIDLEDSEAESPCQKRREQAGHWECIRTLELDVRIPKLQRVEIRIMYEKAASLHLPEEDVGAAFPLLNERKGLLFEYLKTCNTEL